MFIRGKLLLKGQERVYFPSRGVLFSEEYPEGWTHISCPNLDEVEVTLLQVQL